VTLEEERLIADILEAGGNRYSADPAPKNRLPPRRHPASSGRYSRRRVDKLQRRSIKCCDPQSRVGRIQTCRNERRSLTGSVCWRKKGSC